MTRSTATGLALVSVTLVAFWCQVQMTTLIAVSDGHGWDGGTYASMLTSGLDQGNANTQLRPLVIVFNTPLFLIYDDAVETFASMNYLYIAMLALFLGLLAARYAGGSAARTVFVINMVLTIALAKMFAYYPVLIDLGAYAVISAAVYSAVRGPGAVTALACIAAVLAREFGLAVVLFGLHRGWRLGVSWKQLVATYAPAGVTFFAWRYFVQQRTPVGDILTMSDLLENLQLWQDPLFLVLFAYFSLTLFGGLSMALVANAPRCAAFLRREPEWVTFSTLVLAATAVGSADIWRYLAYLVPVAAVLFGHLWRVWSPPMRMWTTGAIFVITWLTQKPFSAMDVGTYFRDWFPYYLSVAPNDVSAAAGDVTLWPVWTWRLLLAAVGVTVMAIMAWYWPAVVALEDERQAAGAS